jgi:hypothetical protein
MESFGVIAFIVGILALVIFLTSWTFSRSRRLLDQWAESNGYRIASAEFCWFRRGPFFWTTSKSQTVYRITVMDSKGHSRSCWARCGGFWWGLWTDRVDVRWDDEL